MYKKAIAYGKKKYPNLTLQVADAHKIPYKSGFFDVVICTEVLEHVENPSKVLQEIKRVMKKNGIAIIELDTGSLLFSIVWYLWRKTRGKVWKDAHLHSFTVRKLKRYMKHYGFKIIKMQTFNADMAMIFAVKK